MATKQLLAQTGAAAPAPGGTGPITAFPGSDGIRLIQVNPAAGAPLVGTLEVRGTNKPAPGAGDFAVIATIDFTGHSSPFTLTLQNSSTSIQVVLTTISAGQVAVFGDSNDGALVGGSGTTLSQATAVVTSSSTTTVVGNFVHVSAASVPSLTSDDVTYALDFNETVTDVLARNSLILDGITTAGVTIADLSLLSGKDAYGLTNADLCKLADVDASASELNQTIGVSANIQTQLDGKVDGAGVDLTGLTVSATDFNFFFDVTPTVAVSTLNTAFTGLIATAADLNALAGTAGDVAPADFVKLGDITASAAEINVLNGLTATAAELNILTGTTVATSDLDAIAGLGLTSVDITELSFLTGLSENVQTALNTITPLVGLTSSVSDLNLLTGAFAGAGAYSGGALTSAEIATLNGISSNIQAQLDSKRNTADTIGIAEITGSSITTVELNFSSGLVGNIQAQIDGLTASSITAAGGTFTGEIFIKDGTEAAPGLGYASANTSGLYLETASAIGLTVLGAKVAELNASFLELGPDTTVGEPWLRHSGFAVTDPQYTFRGDLDSGLAGDGAGVIWLVADGERRVTASATDVGVGGPVASNVDVTVSGIFHGIKELGRATVDGTAAATTVIYTVPAGRSVIVTNILVRIAAAVVGGGGYTGSDNTMRANFGDTGASGDELVDNVTNSAIFNPAYGFDTATQVLPLGSGAENFPAVAGAAGASYQAFAAGATVGTVISVGANFDTFSMDLIILGYEF